MKQIFDPTKITALTRKFEQATIDRENRGLIDRLEKVAKAKTIISKTNDPKERRYVKKVARDKMRMLRQSKQHAINELNFENKTTEPIVSSFSQRSKNIYFCFSMAFILLQREQNEPFI